MFREMTPGSVCLFSVISLPVQYFYCRFNSSLSRSRGASAKCFKVNSKSFPQDCTHSKIRFIAPNLKLQQSLPSLAQPLLSTPSSEAYSAPAPWSHFVRSTRLCTTLSFTHYRRAAQPPGLFHNTIIIMCQIHVGDKRNVYYFLNKRLRTACLFVFSVQ